MLQMQHNKKTGIFYLLNEYGDMSVQEYNQLINNERDVGSDIGTESTTATKPKTSKTKTWTASKDRNNKLSNVEEVGAIAVSQKSARVNQRQQRENSAFTDMGSPNQKSFTGDGVGREQPPCYISLIDEFEEHQNLMNEMASSQKVAGISKNKIEIEKQSSGHAVMAELVIDSPRRDNHQNTALTAQTNTIDYYSTAPRVKPPPKVQAMGTSQAYSEKEAPRQRPGTLKSRFFRTVKGAPSNKKFFSGIGTQLVGFSSNKRLVRWEPGMEE
jgi:hypothetical protein